MCEFTVFKTNWGYFGLACRAKKVIKSVLPIENYKIVTKLLTDGLKNPEFNKNLQKDWQKMIKDYFEGKFSPDLHKIPVYLEDTTPFRKAVYKACANIPLGRTISYADLAAKAGSPKASRAAGTALANNNIPLIIPCHRVIKSDGTLGQFSAHRGSKMKIKLLELEKSLWNYLKVY